MRPFFDSIHGVSYSVLNWRSLARDGTCLVFQSGKWFRQVTLYYCIIFAEVIIECLPSSGGKVIGGSHLVYWSHSLAQKIFRGIKILDQQNRAIFEGFLSTKNTIFRTFFAASFTLLKSVDQ